MNELQVPETETKSALGYYQPTADVQAIKPYGITIEQALKNQLKKIADAGKDPEAPKTASEIKNSQAPFRRAVDALEALDLPRTTDLAYLNSEQGIMHLAEKTAAPALAADVDPDKKLTIMRARSKLFSSLGTIVNKSKPSTVANALFDTEKMLLDRKDPLAFDRQRYIRAGTAKKLSLPKFGVYSKALNKGIQSIPDKEARAYAALKLMTGLRDTEFPRILTEIPENGVGYFFDPEHSTVKYYNKGVVTDYHLGTNASEILKELQEDARKEGRKNVFSKKASSLKTGGLPSIREAIKNAELTPAINRKTGKPVDFTFGHLRKNLFDSAQKTFDKDTANAILGHAQKGDIGLDFYAVERQGEVSKAGQAVDTLFKKFGIAVGKTGPRNIFKSWQFNRASERLPATFPDVEVDPDAQKLLDRTTDAETKIVVTGQNIDQGIKNIDRKTAGLEGALTRFEKIQQQVDELRGKNKAPTEKVPVTLDLDNINYAALGYSPDDVKNIQEASMLDDSKALTNAIQVAEDNKAVANTSRVKKIFESTKKGAKMIAPFLPIVGGAFGALGVSETQAAEKKQYAEQGEESPAWLSALREGQMIEEVVSPLPVTTHDIEQGVKYIAKETPKTMAKQKEQVMDPTLAGGFARQQAGQFKSTFASEYEGFIPTR